MIIIPIKDNYLLNQKKILKTKKLTKNWNRIYEKYTLFWSLDQYQMSICSKMVGTYSLCKITLLDRQFNTCIYVLN